MPSVAPSLFSLLFIAYLAVLLSIGSVYAQVVPSILVPVSDVSKWSNTGSLVLLSTLGDFTNSWLNYTGGDTGTASASTSFLGIAVAIYGTIVNGTGNQPLNVSVKLDSSDISAPIYVPNANVSKGFDYNNKIYTSGSLPYQVHTLTVTYTGTTSFFLQGILYDPTNSTTSSTASPPVGTGPTSVGDPPNDTAKLAGAIGGGIGALLLVGIIILLMMRRLRRIEKNERKLQAIPFLANTGPRSGTYTPTATVRSVPRTNPQSSTAVDEKIPLREQTTTAASSSRSFPRHHKSSIPSPAASIISVPSEFQHATTIVPAGTAVASSYIGTSPLPPVALPDDVPPMPAIPADVKRKTKSIRRKEKQERQERNTSIDQSSPNSGGLGLFSTDSVNTIGTTGSAGLSRPLPIVPGTRSSAPSYQFPPEKVGLSPPPARRERSGSASKKRPLPEPTAPPSSR